MRGISAMTGHVGTFFFFSFLNKVNFGRTLYKPIWDSDIGLAK